jgi:acetolactate synthase-1/2/3 large subunit
VAPSHAIHPLRLCRDVVAAAPPETIFVLDGGDILSFARLLVEPDRPGRFLDPGPYGCLGIGLPFANAAKLARPDARSYASRPTARSGST